MNSRALVRAQQTGEHGSARTFVLVVLFFLLGLGTSKVWFHRSPKVVTVGKVAVELSPGTRTVLAGLDKPLEIRFYSLLDPNASTNLRDFSGRVEQLLEAYQQMSNGKITFAIHTNASPNTAIADGIKGFDLDKGEGRYLGLALSCAGRKEVLAQLSPDWEAALEADISRAIQRVTELADNNKPKPAPENPAVTEEIRRQIPNLNAVSAEEASKILRENSIKQFTAAVGKMNALVQEAQEDLVKAQKQGSAAEQEAAMKRLQAIQTEESQKLKQIAAEAQARMDALMKLKANGK
jgi:hypothetical protein